MLTDDPAFLRRFLCGLATEAERDEVERRLIEDPAFGETVGALDDELLLAYARRELDAELRLPLDECLRVSATRRNRLRETEAVLSALAAAAKPAGHTSRDGRGRVEGLTRRWVPFGVAASIVVALSSAWFLSGGPAGVPASPESAGHGSASGSIATLTLAAGVSRATTAQQNILRLPPGADRVRLIGDITIVAAGGSRILGTIEPVGGAALDLPVGPTLATTGGAARMEWVIPAAAVPPGDYIVRLTAEIPGGGRETLGEWFVSAVR